MLALKRQLKPSTHPLFLSYCFQSSNAGFSTTKQKSNCPLRSYYFQCTNAGLKFKIKNHHPVPSYCFQCKHFAPSSDFVPMNPNKPSARSPPTPSTDNVTSPIPTINTIYRHIKNKIYKAQSTVKNIQHTAMHKG